MKGYSSTLYKELQLKKMYRNTECYDKHEKRIIIYNIVKNTLPAPTVGCSGNIHVLIVLFANKNELSIKHVKDTLG